MDIINEIMSSQSSDDIIDLKNMNLYELPELPSHITKLNVSGNYFTKLDNLPPNLKFLDASNNRLESIILPEKLAMINLTYNNLKEVNIPATTKQLSLAYNDFDKIPELPAGIQHLDISHNHIKIIDQLPDNMKGLAISDNQIEEITRIPVFMESLYCSNNKLTKLPDLPACLIQLNCAGNNIKELPELPRHLAVLDCEDNEIEKLPIISKEIQFINYEKNKLIEQPKLSTKFLTFRFNPYTDVREDVRSPDHLEILPNCYDYEVHKEVRTSAFMTNPNNILIKLYDDYYGIPRQTLLEYANKRSNIYKDIITGDNYIKIIMLKLVSLIDFEKFNSKDYSIYIISRTHDFSDFRNTVKPGCISDEKMAVHPYTLQKYIETQF
jgi:Leucine-rich repeat (LRR) protein